MNQRPSSLPLRVRGSISAILPLGCRVVGQLHDGTPALMRGFKVAVQFATALALATGAAVRAEPQTATPVADPPARVGRVSLLQGRVDTSSAPGAAWEPAQLNQPVTTQTAFWAPPGSQAELRVGSSSVRLDGNTQAVFSQLDDHGVAIDLAQGTVRARVRNLPTGDAFSLSADGVRAEAQQPGDYRVSHDPDRRATTVRTVSGRMRVVTPSNSFNLEAGQESLIEAGGASLQVRPLSGRDDFDRWAEARDREQDRLAALRHVSPEMTGVESLDEHGVWDQDSQYGAVWYPGTLPPGWAPYRYGRWAWVSPWGWTWIDDSPWGFAPFHYGRWALIGQRWAWVPGPLSPRPVWAPALVGYVGGRSGSVGWSIGIGAPVGWFPLAPYEVYRPPYRHSVTYVNQINIIQQVPAPAPAAAPVPAPRPPGRPWRGSDGPGAGALPLNPAAPLVPGTGVQPAYRYANRPDALTVVSEDSFRHARPVGREHIPLTPRQAAELQPIVPVAPILNPGPAPMEVQRPPAPSLPLPPPPTSTLPARPELPPAPRLPMPQAPGIPQAPQMPKTPQAPPGAAPMAPAAAAAPLREPQVVPHKRWNSPQLEQEIMDRPRVTPGSAVAAPTPRAPIAPAAPVPPITQVTPVTPVTPSVQGMPRTGPDGSLPGGLRGGLPNGMAQGSTQGSSQGSAPSLSRAPAREARAEDDRAPARMGKPVRRGEHPQER